MSQRLSLRQEGEGDGGDSDGVIGDEVPSPLYRGR